ncbi:hypothetical protein CTI14_68410, partial [Methylobacterium radiotolerans]
RPRRAGLDGRQRIIATAMPDGPLAGVRVVVGRDPPDRVAMLEAQGSDVRVARASTAASGSSPPRCRTARWRGCASSSGA